MTVKEIPQDSGAGSGPGFPGGLPAPCKSCCSLFARCLLFALSISFRGLILSLIFDISELCVKGFRLGDGEKDPLQPHPPGLSVKWGLSPFLSPAHSLCLYRLMLLLFGGILLAAKGRCCPPMATGSLPASCHSPGEQGLRFGSVRVNSPFSPHLPYHS